MRHTLRAAWARLGAPGRTALGAVIVTLMVLAWTLPPLVAALLMPEPDPVGRPSAPPGSQADRYAAFVAQIDGRSLFFVPAAPPPAPAIVQTGEPPPPPPPARYAGPGLIGMINDQAWFADGRVLKAGGEARNGLRVLRLDPPWGAVVEWSGVEFRVTLFERDAVVAPPQGPAEAPPSRDAAGGPGPAEEIHVEENGPPGLPVRTAREAQEQP